QTEKQDLLETPRPPRLSGTMRGMDLSNRPPLLQVMAALAWRFSIAFELLALGVHFGTKGERPVAGKFWAITIATIAAAICHATLRNYHRAHRRYIHLLELNLRDPHAWTI